MIFFSCSWAFRQLIFSWYNLGVPYYFVDHTGNTANKGKVIPYLSIDTISQQEAHTYLAIHLYGVIPPSWAPHEGDFKFHISALWTRFAFRIITPQAAITFFSWNALYHSLKWMDLGIVLGNSAPFFLRNFVLFSMNSQLN